MKPGNVARKCTIGVAATLLVALTACSARGEDVSADGGRLMDTRWVLVDVAGVPAISAVQATLEFPKAGEFGGNNSCNHFGGQYKASVTRFEVTGLMQTLIGCEPPIAAQEMRYMQALGAAERVEFEGDALLIYCKGFDEPLRFSPAT